MNGLDPRAVDAAIQESQKFRDLNPKIICFEHNTSLLDENVRLFWRCTEKQNQLCKLNMIHSTLLDINKRSGRA